MKTSIGQIQITSDQASAKIHVRTQFTLTTDFLCYYQLFKCRSSSMHWCPVNDLVRLPTTTGIQAWDFVINWSLSSYFYYDTYNDNYQDKSQNCYKINIRLIDPPESCTQLRPSAEISSECWPLTFRRGVARVGFAEDREQFGRALALTRRFRRRRENARDVCNHAC